MYFNTKLDVMQQFDAIFREINSLGMLTDCVHMRLKLGESPKSRILTKLGCISQLMGKIYHALRFCCGPTLTAVTAHPKIDFY